MSLTEKIAALEGCAAPLTALRLESRALCKRLDEVDNAIMEAEVAEETLERLRCYAAYALGELTDPDRMVAKAVDEAERLARAEQAGQEAAQSEAVNALLADVAQVFSPTGELPSVQAAPELALESVPEVAPLEAPPEPEATEVANEVITEPVPPEEQEGVEALTRGDDELEIHPIHQQILDWLTAHPGAHLAREIAAGMPDPPKSLSPYLTTMFRVGQLKRSGPGGPKEPYRFSIEEGEPAASDVPPVPRPNTALQILTDWLTAHPGPHLCREIAAGLGLVPQNISGDLTKLNLSGTVQRTGLGGPSDPFRYFVATGEVSPEPLPTVIPEEPTASEPQQPAPVSVPTVVHTPEALLEWLRLRPGTHSAQDFVDAEGGNRLAVQLQLSALASKGQLRRFGSQSPGNELTFCFPQPLAPVVGLPMWASPNAEALEAAREKALEKLNASSEYASQTAKNLSVQLNLDGTLTETALESLAEEGKIERVSLIRENEIRGVAYRKRGLKLARLTMDDLATPPRIDQEQAALFEHLKRTPHGQTERTLLVQLQWRKTQLERVCASMLRAGHIRRDGETYSVLPPVELW